MVNEADGAILRFSFERKSNESLVYYALGRCYSEAASYSAKFWDAFYGQHRVTLSVWFSNNIDSLFLCFFV